LAGPIDQAGDRDAGGQHDCGEHDDHAHGERPFERDPFITRGNKEDLNGKGHRPGQSVAR
jgi:hypothetical protein